MYDRGMDKGKFSIYCHCETERSECRGNLSHSSFVIARPNGVSVAAIFGEYAVTKGIRALGSRHFCEAGLEYAYAYTLRDWSLRLTRTFAEWGLSMPMP